MTDAIPLQTRAPTDWSSASMQRLIKRRYAAERRFRLMGFFAVALSALSLAVLLFTMVGNGLNGFRQTELSVTLDFPTLTPGTSAESLRGPSADAAIQSMDLPGIVGLGVEQAYGSGGGDYVTAGAPALLRAMLLDDPAMVTRKAEIWLPVASPIDIAYKSRGSSEAEKIVAKLASEGKLRSRFNWNFLSASDATDPADVGIWGALKGSLLTLIITLAIAFPVGVLAAVYLEEYAPKNRFTDLIEVSINNLAAVPSIIFGLLGLVVFLT